MFLPSLLEGFSTIYELMSNIIFMYVHILHNENFKILIQLSNTLNFMIFVHSYCHMRYNLCIIIFHSIVIYYT